MRLTYITNVNRSYTKVDNVVDVSLNPNGGQKRKGKANNKSAKVVKHVDLCDVYGSPLQQPKQPNQPPNGYIVTLLKFVDSNVSLAVVENFTIKVRLV